MLGITVTVPKMHMVQAFCHNHLEICHVNSNHFDVCLTLDGHLPVTVPATHHATVTSKPSCIHK